MIRYRDAQIDKELHVDAGSVATIVGPLKPHGFDRPDDEFEVRFRGELIRVRREDVKLDYRYDGTPRRG